MFFVLFAKVGDHVLVLIRFLLLFFWKLGQGVMRRSVVLLEVLVKSSVSSHQFLDENIEVRKLIGKFSQDGPFLGSKVNDRACEATDRRHRRELQRVPAVEAPYVANETSFRRLPRDVRLPVESELRGLYPQSTGLEIFCGEAHCVDQNAFSIDEEPSPISYSMLTPKGWTKEEECPFMVVLSDGFGTSRDFEDVCSNMFERPVHQALMNEQRWVIVSPVINVNKGFQNPVEAVVARFCDWVVSTYRVEHGRVHLFGKGCGAYAALRTCLEQKDVAISVVALLGRNGSPYRPMDRAQVKMKNYNGVHSLVFVPGLLFKQDYYYKFKLMMDLAKVRPPLRNIHFADVKDHQLYYAINPVEFWNHMLYFRQYNTKMLVDTSTTSSTL